MFSVNVTGSFDNTERFLKKILKGDIYRGLEGLAQQGVSALASATPVETGMLSASWGYEIERNGRDVTITWTNSNIESGVPIAVILQYGHGTGTGGYVQGRDYINPAIKPVMDRIAESVWREVTS